MNEDYLLKFAKVKFGYGSFTYDYLCGNLDLTAGDKVLVPTKKGPKEATVVYVSRKGLNMQGKASIP